MSLITAYGHIKEVGQQLLQANINPPFSGNISIREKNNLYITTHGSNLGALKESEVIKVSLDGSHDEHPNASVELGVHQKIYQNLPDAGAIIHAHPASAVALSFQLEEIVPIDLEGRYYLPEIPVVFIPYDEYLELAPAKIPPYLNENKVVIVRGHGSFVRGKDITEAFHLTVVTEQVCRLIINDTLLDRA